MYMQNKLKKVINSKWHYLVAVLFASKQVTFKLLYFNLISERQRDR